MFKEKVSRNRNLEIIFWEGGNGEKK